MPLPLKAKGVPCERDIPAHWTMRAPLSGLSPPMEARLLKVTTSSRSRALGSSTGILAEAQVLRVRLRRSQSQYQQCETPRR